jgi:opacity protein-like surface antigen
MRRTLACLGLVACAALAPAAARANDGLYLELQGGGSFWQDADVSVDGVGSGTAEFEDGWNAGAALGFRIFEMLRLEAHASYRQADLDRVDVGPLSVSGEGFAGAAAVLGNAYFDIPVPLPIKPYVGGGAGVAIFWADVDGNSIDVDDDDTEFAWNVMGGVFIPVLRHLELDVRYRYLRSDDPEVDADFLGLGEGTARAEFEVHEVVGALRVVF